MLACSLAFTVLAAIFLFIGWGAWTISFPPFLLYIPAIIIALFDRKLYESLMDDDAKALFSASHTKWLWRLAVPLVVVAAAALALPAG